MRRHTNSRKNPKQEFVILIYSLPCFPMAKTQSISFNDTIQNW